MSAAPSDDDVFGDVAMHSSATLAAPNPHLHLCCRGRECAVETVKKRQQYLTLRSGSSSQRTESEEIELAVMQMLLALANRMKMKNWYPQFAFSPDLSGSVKEQTKCYRPNEFDVICRMQNVETCTTVLTQRTTSGDVRCSDTSGMFKGYLEHGCIHAGKFMSGFYNACDHILKYFVQSKQLAKFDRLHLIKCPVLLRDKISCVQALWKGTHFKEMMIYIDIVPAVYMNANHPTHRLPFGVMSENYYLVAKTSRHLSKRYDRFTLSYHDVELRILNAAPAECKEGYIVAKALRIATICCPRNEIKLGLQESIKCDDNLITSYILKNCLFSVLVRETMEQDKCIKRSVFQWADAIYEELEKCLNQRFLPVWFDALTSREGSRLDLDNRYLLHGFSNTPVVDPYILSNDTNFIHCTTLEHHVTSHSDVDTDDIEISCVAPETENTKLRVMLCVTKQIRAWLKTHSSSFDDW